MNVWEWFALVIFVCVFIAGLMQQHRANTWRAECMEMRDEIKHMRSVLSNHNGRNVRLRQCLQEILDVRTGVKYADKIRIPHVEKMRQLATNGLDADNDAESN